MKTILKVLMVFGIFFLFWFINTAITDGNGVFTFILENITAKVSLPSWISERSFVLILDRALFFTIIMFVFRLIDESGLKIIKKSVGTVVSFAMFLLIFFILSFSIFDKFNALYPF